MRRALNRRKRRFPARAVHPMAALQAAVGDAERIAFAALAEVAGGASLLSCDNFKARAL